MSTQPDHLGTASASSDLRPAPAPPHALANGHEDSSQRLAGLSEAVPPVVLLRRGSMPLSSSTESSPVAPIRVDSPSSAEAFANAVPHDLQSPTSPTSPTDPAAFFDHTLVDAYTRSAKDRIMLIKADLEMERFVLDPSQSRLPIQPPCFTLNNTYQRLLIHRLADSYGLHRVLDPTAPPPTTGMPALINGNMTGLLYLVKSPQSRIPPVRLNELKSLIVRDPPLMVPEPRSPSASFDDQPPPSTTSPAPSIYRIMPRAQNSDAGRPRSSASAEEISRRALTLEEREAAYAAARQRIFDAQEEHAPPVDGEVNGNGVGANNGLETPLLRPHALRPSAPSFDPLGGYASRQQEANEPVASTSSLPGSSERLADPPALATATMPAGYEGRRRSGSRSPSSASISTVASSKTSRSTSSSLSDSVSRTSRRTSHSTSSQRISAAQSVMRFAPSPAGTPLFPPSHPQRPASPSPSTASISTTSSRSVANSVSLGPGLPDLEPMGRRSKARKTAQRKKTPPPPEPPKPLHPSLPVKPAWLQKMPNTSPRRNVSDDSEPHAVETSPILQQQQQQPPLATPVASAPAPIYAMPMIPMLPPGQVGPPYYALPPMAYYGTVPGPPPVDGSGVPMVTATSTTTTTTTMIPTWDPHFLAAYQHQQYMETMMQQMRLANGGPLPPTTHSQPPPELMNAVAGPPPPPLLQLDEDAPRAARPPSMALFDPSSSGPAGRDMRRTASGSGGLGRGRLRGGIQE